MARDATALAMPISITFNRKRKDLELGDDSEDDYDFQRASNLKECRQFSQLPRGDEEAQFYPLPHDLNLQILTNLGYDVNDHEMDISSTTSDDYDKSNVSPSSLASDLSPSTPNDIQSSSAESYFTKGIRSQSSPSYPNFNIYPEHIYPRPPGLLGMNMQSSYKLQTNATPENKDGMEVDNEEIKTDNEPGPSHGSIPQLHCRGTGATRELWAHCRDCGTMSPVDSAPIPPALSYSP